MRAHLVQLGAVQAQRLHLLLGLRARVLRQARKLVGLLLGLLQVRLRRLLLAGQLLRPLLGLVRAGILQQQGDTSVSNGSVLGRLMAGQQLGWRQTPTDDSPSSLQHDN